MILAIAVVVTAGMALAQAPQGGGQGAGGGRGGQGGGGGRGQGGGGGGRGGGGGIISLAVSSTSFADGAEIPAKNVGGTGVSPQLSWTGAPATTMSYALIMHDTDASTDGTVTGDITHWVVWNIPAATTSLPEGGPVPAGVGQLSLRGPQYMGPAPPAGHPYHHYIFTVYALSSTLDVPAGATRQAIEAAMAGKIVARGTIVGRAKPAQ